MLRWHQPPAFRARKIRHGEATGRRAAFRSPALLDASYRSRIRLIIPPARETSRRGREQCGVVGNALGECVAKIERFEIEFALTGVRLNRDLEGVNDEAHVFASSVAKRH